MRLPSKDDVAQIPADAANSGTRVIHGSGKFVFPNGAVYAGEWSLVEELSGDIARPAAVGETESAVTSATVGLKQRHGFGRYQHGPDLYVGWWARDKMHGRGRYESDAGCYEGEFAADQFCGMGSFQWPSRAYYTGEWRQGKMHGKGIFVSAEGVRWEGVFQNDYFVNREGVWLVPNVDQQVWVGSSNTDSVPVTTAIKQ